MNEKNIRYDDMTKTKNHIVAILLMLFACFWASCASEPKPESEKKDAEYEIVKDYPRGPVRFTQMLSRKEITIAEREDLVLEVRAKEAYEVDLPRFGEKLEQFGIVDYHTPPPELLDGGVVLTRKTYVLEPFLSGEYTIPPMTVVFREKGVENPEEHKIETEAIAIRVKSLMPEDVEKLEIKDIRPPLEIPRNPNVRLYGMIAGGVALLAAVAGLFFYLRRRNGKLAEVRIPPQDAAFQALEELLARKLVEKGEFKAFYLGLSDILRKYIEGRFGLHAPERTTEEFMEEMRGTERLEPNHKALLQHFLEHCDLVKFAEYTPTNKEIQETFDSCKRFILETEHEDVPSKNAVPPDHTDDSAEKRSGEADSTERVDEVGA